MRGVNTERIPKCPRLSTRFVAIRRNIAQLYIGIYSVQVTHREIHRVCQLNNDLRNSFSSSAEILK